MLLAASTSVVWAFAFPLIKLGIAEWGIEGGDTGAKTLFAGVRFFCAGIIVLMTHFIKPREKRASVHMRAFLGAALLGLVNTALHYFCYYIGLSNQSGSSAAVIDSMSTFLLILLACAVFKDERMTVRKAVGCSLGFAGILIVNAGSVSSGGFSFMGEGMLMMSCCFSALGGIITKLVVKKGSAAFSTGISLGLGGLLLIAAGLMMGGRLSLPTRNGLFILCCLIAISTYGFSVYNKLLSCNPVGETAIFSSLIPILGVTFSCVLLKEPFRVQYAAAGLLVSAGIFIVNHVTISEIK